MKENTYFFKSIIFFVQLKKQIKIKRKYIFLMIVLLFYLHFILIQFLIKFKFNNFNDYIDNNIKNVFFLITLIFLLYLIIGHF